MAYDKVVDSAVLDAGLKATADAIREKTGDTALIQWMNENGFKAAVEAIEAGGSLSYTEGSFTLAEDTTSNYTFSVDNTNLINDEYYPYHKLVGIVWLSKSDSLVEYDNGSYGGVWAACGDASRASYGGGWTGSGGTYSSTYGLFLTDIEDGEAFIKFGSGAGYIGKAGYTYRYFIWRAYA